MITSLKTSWRSVSSLEDKPIPPAMLGYFQGSTKDSAHEEILKVFLESSEKDGMTRAFIARRIGKTPEQITRWLGAPGNWTLDTLTNLAIAMGYRPRIALERLSEMRQSNQYHPLAQAPYVCINETTSQSKIPPVELQF